MAGQLPAVPASGHRTIACPLIYYDASILAMLKTRDEKADKVQFNVYLPPELVRRVKHRAIDEGQSLSVLVEHVLGEYLTRHEESHD
jgi:hypothetical protein